MADTPDKPDDGADPYELSPEPKAPKPATPPLTPKIEAGRFIDDVDEEMGEDEYSQLKLDSADAIKMALKSNDTRSLIDALDAYLRC